MGKIGLITWREYITRVRKKSFLIMTILGPLLIAAFYGVIIYLAVSDGIGKETERILVYDQANVLKKSVESDDKMAFEYSEGWEDRNHERLSEDGYAGWLYIPEGINKYDPKGIVYESDKSVSIESKERIKSRISSVFSNQKMKELGVSASAMDSIKTRVSIAAQTIGESGEAKDSNIEIRTILGMVLSFAIYFFIFLYGVQVMKGVIEEKTNRIVEIIVSSVKPFQLMMGKVFGLALVGLTQIVIWIVLSMIFIGVITTGVLGDSNALMEMAQSAQDMPVDQMTNGMSMAQDTMLDKIRDLNFPFIITTFVVFFLGGYLMYSALFAAVGAAVDSETDTQQFMLPITLPLVFAIAISTSVVMRDPNGPLSFWLSMIPLTSPVVMMVRAPLLNAATQWWEVALSMGILVVSFVFVIWLAGKIYRTGILMYGKKPTYKELYKWLFYKS